MSHKYRPPDSELRPDPGQYSSDGMPTSLERDLYRPASFFPSSSSSRGSAQWSQEGALSILSSCGLEPSDLSLLAELPEDVLTVESLPHVLNQLKGKRGTVKPFSTNAPSFSSPPSHPPSSRDWDQLHSQPVQYPLGQVTSRPLPSEKVQDHWGKHSSSVRAEPPSFSSSSSSYMLDFHHRPGLSEYGMTGRATRAVDPPSVRLTAQEDRTCPSSVSESGSAGYMLAPPPEEHRHKAQGRRYESQPSSIGSSWLAGATSMPTRKEALDFHGMLPQVFPYSCSLCDITVLSERVWTKHTNGTCHADGQLSLLQRCPKWDCRVETVSRDDSQSEKSKHEERPTRPPSSAHESQESRSNKQSTTKASDRSKVVCVKFPAQSVDETYLRKLAEPFGTILEMLMFPSLAFVEMASVDQAKDLVKFHNCPPIVNGEQIEFSISNTFSFSQNSRVVSFNPAPTGEDGRSDLISIVKRFGLPLYTLFLPSKVFVEMKNLPDAQKMVDYYSTKPLRINSDLIQVSLSREYRSLMQVASATRYEEETPPTKTASRSREQEETQSKRKRPRSRERSRERSRDRSRERSRAKRSRSRDKSNGEKKSRSRSRSREESCGESSMEDGPREKTMEPEKIKNHDSKPEPADNRASEEEELSAEDSDIEGMEVIGEDGEFVDAEEDEEDEEEKSAAEKTDSTPEEKEKENVVKEEEEEESSREGDESAQTQLEDEVRPDFPVDLENCITLDELDEEEEEELQSTDSVNAAERQSPTTRVIFFKNLPLRFYTDAGFVRLVKGVGTAVRYFLIRRQQQGFIEMSTSAEALKAARVLNQKTFHGSRLFVNISHKYTRLVNGYDIQSDSDIERSESQSSRRDGSSTSRTSDRDKISRRSESRRESDQNTTPERDLSQSKSPERESGQSKSEKRELSPKMGPEHQVLEGNKENICSQSENKCLPEKKQETQNDEAAKEKQAAMIPEDTSETVQNPPDSDDAVKQEQTPEGGVAEPEKPTKPVGTKFVRPVVGYLCHLCQVIYADEDEAKLQHCSTLMHYRKYQEKTGIDPWRIRDAEDEFISDGN